MKNGHVKRQAVIAKLPPHNLEAEQSVIGAILLDPLATLPVCIAKIGTDSETFYDIKHQTLYRILVEMYDAQEVIDLITLADWLRFQSALDDVGGVVYLMQLQSGCASAANITFHLEIILDRRRTRKLIQITTEASEIAQEYQQEPTELISRVSQDLIDLSSSSITKEEETPMPELIAGCIDRIELWHQTQGQTTGLASGFSDMDRLTTGFQPGEMVVIAARPGMGKTALALNIVDHVAIELGLHVGVFSLEMTSQSLVMRMLCARARVNLRSLSGGFLAERDFPKLTAAAGRLNHSPIHINDTSSLSILGLRTRARQMHRQYGIRLLVIDYLQLMHAETSRNASRQEEVSKISSGCKQIAKDLDIPVIALSQLNREVERDKNRRPRLSDLRESGSIEQDADVVAFLYQPAIDSAQYENEAVSAPVHCYIAKQRNGPTGEVPLTFMKCYTRFESASKVDSSDVQAQAADAQADAQQEFESYSQTPD